MTEEFIEVYGAREHNLKNIDVKIPRNKLVVITGLSGSGKSSLAFDTIYAEGQRRYMETFSAYARQFLGGLERPDVEKIDGLSPVIAIEQKTISKNPRSTVGTITEIYDFLRLIYSRASNAYSYNTGELMVRYTDQQILDFIYENYSDKKLILLAPLVRGRKGHYRELFEQMSKDGYVRARVDGEVKEIVPGMKLDRYKRHDIEVVIDRVEVNKKSEQRIFGSVESSMDKGRGNMLIMEHGAKETKHLSRFLMCPTTGISYAEPEPNLFSFNSPYGACSKCNGLGIITEMDFKKIVPDTSKSIKNGGIKPLGEVKTNWIFSQIEGLLKAEGQSLTTKISDIEEGTMSSILYGSDELINVETSTGTSYSVKFEGVFPFLERQVEDNSSTALKRWAMSFTNKIACPTCEGTRLKKESLHFKIDGFHIADLAQMDLKDLVVWFETIEDKLNEKQNIIATEPLKEIRSRISFLMDVGLDYLTLDRSAKTLSGGEAQRIRLATQIGSQLVGVLYILDEPSIGLHQRDNNRLIASLKNLRDVGNSIIVVEHDKDMMLASDHLIDIGPGAGINGGHIVVEGNPQKHLDEGSVTSDYLSGKQAIEVPKKRRKGTGKNLILSGCIGHNLKDVKVKFPLGKFICVTGVSGSGKSSLINQTLYPILNNHFYKGGVKKPLPYKKISGLEHLDKVIEIDQSPIGRTPRSNPATYTGLFSEIRNLFTRLPEAKIRGYKPGRFSFNVKGGRCETCKGAGVKTIEMNFLPDVYVTCETCHGKRYNRETLEVRYKGKSIADVLDMTIETGLEFFEQIPKINRILSTLHAVGLGYVTIGQQSTTLSGGEAQRVKLANELSKISTGQTFYILDEPTTGLHFEDIKMLINVLNKLVDQGNTVLVIEHNLDLVKIADHIIDIGPDGGKNGGQLIAEGTPEKIIQNTDLPTGKYLAKEMGVKLEAGS